MDDKKSPQDEAAAAEERVHWTDVERIDALARELGVSRNDVIGALQAVGPRVAAVKRFLTPVKPT